MSKSRSSSPHAQVELINMAQSYHNVPRMVIALNNINQQIPDLGQRVMERGIAIIIRKRPLDPNLSVNRKVDRIIYSIY